MGTSGSEKYYSTNENLYHHLRKRESIDQFSTSEEVIFLMYNNVSSNISAQHHSNYLSLQQKIQI